MSQNIFSDVALAAEWPYLEDPYSDNMLMSPHQSGDQSMNANSILSTPPALADYPSSPSAFSVNPSSPSVAPRLLGDPVLGASSPDRSEWLQKINEVERSTSSPNTESPRLIVHPINVKSRVETQVIMRLSLHPMPPGLTRLHLPSYAISKPKLLAKPPPQSAPDMYELDAILVCTTATQAKEKMQQALTRAATNSPRDRDRARLASSAGSLGDVREERESLNGGDVNICNRCMERERKRLNRRRNKRPEEEEDWSRDEHMRIIVFNTREIQEWGEPKPDPDPSSPKTGPEPELPEGTKQVMLPVRIACYCRHHHEKIGFRVIFTLKDHQGRLVTQGVTDSIMITDDHKKDPVSPGEHIRRPSSEGRLGSRTVGMQPAFSVDDLFPVAGPSSQPTLSPGGAFPGATQTISPLAASIQFSSGDIAPVRQSHSISDLQSLRNNYVSPFPSMAPGLIQRSTQSLSASATPRALSPQAHLSGPSGPATKRRKAGSAGRVPESLAMTRLDTATAQMSSVATSPGSARTAGSFAPSPHAVNDAAFMPSSESVFNFYPMPFRPYFSSTVPATPSGSGQGLFSQGHSLGSPDDITLHQAFYSAPTSAHHSRAPSPTSLPRAKIESQLGLGTPAVTDESSSQWQQPVSIYKLIPSEGPKAGNIDISVVGDGFYSGLEVMFGENKAKTTFWNKNLLVCLLPRNTKPGEVLIRFKHESQPQLMPLQGSSMTRIPVTFRYIDTEEDHILRSALSMIGQQMTGRIEDAVDVARRIRSGETIGWQAGCSEDSLTTDMYSSDVAMAE